MTLSKVLILSILFIFIMYFGQFILLPLSLALFVFIIVKSLSEKLLFYVNKYLKLQLGELISTLLMFSIISFFTYFISIIFKFNILNVIDNSFFYQKNIEKIFQYSPTQYFNEVIPLENVLNSLNFVNLLSTILNGFTNFAGNFAFILIFFIFIIAEKESFLKKIQSITEKKNIKIIQKINNDIFNYFQLKSLTSFYTALLTFLSLEIIGNDLAPSFAILSFLFNFIPFLGSIISIILPSIFAIIQFVDFYQPIATLIVLVLVQIFIGNFLEPKLMGKTLNISPLVMIIFLAVMGKIWGIAGMFLSVPFLVVLLIIMRNIKSLKNIAIFLSDKI